MAMTVKKSKTSRRPTKIHITLALDGAGPQIGSGGAHRQLARGYGRSRPQADRPPPLQGLGRKREGSPLRAPVPLWPETRGYAWLARSKVPDAHDGRPRAPHKDLRLLHEFDEAPWCRADHPERRSADSAAARSSQSTKASARRRCSAARRTFATSTRGSAFTTKPSRDHGRQHGNAATRVLLEKEGEAFGIVHEAFDDPSFVEGLTPSVL